MTSISQKTSSTSLSSPPSPADTADSNGNTGSIDAALFSLNMGAGSAVSSSTGTATASNGSTAGSTGSSSSVGSTATFTPPYNFAFSNINHINSMLEMNPTSAPNTSAFFPNSSGPGAILEDPMAPSVPGSAPSFPIAVRIQNLPRDITSREFKVLFTFAPDFLYCELQKSSGISDDGLPSNVIGYAYFKTISAATNVQAVLDSRNDVFFFASAPNSPGSISPASININNAASLIPLKCDIRTPRHMSIDPSLQQAGGLPRLSKPGSSRFVFPSSSAGSVASSTPTGGTSAEIPLAFGNNASAVSGVGPNDYYPTDGGVFSPTSPRSLFPQQQNSIPADLSSLNGDFFPRVSGKSLLLESQSKDDEEYNDIVKDPVGWFSRNNSYTAVAGAQMQVGPMSQQQGPPQNIQGHPQGPVGPVGPSQGPSNASGTQNGPPPPPNSQQSLHHQHSFDGQMPPGIGLKNTPPNGYKTSNSRASSVSATVGAPAPIGSSGPSSAQPNQWTDKRRGSTTRAFQSLSIGGQPANGAATSSVGAGAGVNADNSKVVVPYSPTNSGAAIQIMQSGGRVLPPANPADQNPPCNTLYVGNLPPDTSEEELKDLFSTRRGYKRLCFRTKANGPMCFVEFEDVAFATRALEELYGFGLSNSVKGGIRLSFSKNPLGVRSQSTVNVSGTGSNNGGSSSNGGNVSNTSLNRLGSLPPGLGSYSRVGYNNQMNYSDANVVSNYLVGK